MQTTLRIILMIDTSRACERRFVQGIVKYSQLHGPWVFYRKPKYYITPNRTKVSLEQLQNFRADGIIVSDAENLQNFLALNLPTLIHTVKKKSYEYPSLIGDCTNSAIMAAEHLLDRGFQHFAFCGVGNFYWSKDRFISFRNRLKQAGFEPHYYKQNASRFRKSFQEEQAKLAKWLKSLPKPIGLMTCADDCSQHVVEACELAHLHIPDEIAIIGVDNDEMVCELTNPSLTSVALDFERAGYKSAELLAKLIAGEKVIDQNITVLPTHIATRQSTDILAIKDADVRMAVKYIRNNSRKPIQTEDVLNAVGCARRTLHRKFKQTLSRSVSEEIRRNRVELIATSLQDTEMPISQIARTFGYDDAHHIARYFRQEKGMTPLEYRKKYGIAK